MRRLLQLLVPAVAFTAGIFVGPHFTTPAPAAPPPDPVIGKDPVTIVGVTVERFGTSPEATYFAVVTEAEAKSHSAYHVVSLHHPFRAPTVIQYGVAK